MTLSKAKRIVVCNTQFPYVLRPSKERYIGNSSSLIRLIFQDGKRYITADFLSKKYDPNLHDECYEKHINSWTPKHTRQVIEYYISTGNIDNNLILDGWEFSV